MTSKRTGEQLEMPGLGLWSGKMSPEHCQATAERTSKPSCRKSSGLREVTPLYLDLRKSGVVPGLSWEMGGALLGEFTTRSFGESPSVVVESRLSQILEVNPPPQYCLSAKACEGILRRAARRGKELPPELKEALEKQLTYTT